MKFLNVLTIILLQLCLWNKVQAQSTLPMNKVVAKVKQFTSQYKQRPFVVNFNKGTAPEGFQIACAVGKICPSKNVPLTYVTTTKLYPQDFKNSWLRLFFKKNDLKNLSIPVFRYAFDFASFEIDFSHFLYVPGYTITVSEDGERGMIEKKDHNNWTFESYQGGMLKGSFRKKLTSISISRSDDWAAKNCDIMNSKISQECWKKMSISLPVELRFNLPVDREVLDCELADQGHPICGK